MGECSRETAFEILDYFYANGGNFIDTANGYQDEENEAWIGEWMETKGVRDQMVIATKYTGGCRRGTDPNVIHSNYAGNSTKSLFASVEASLKKLKASYIDIPYVRWWDFTTSYQEVMKSLNTLADQGKILYLGFSDTPAWIVARASQWARDHGLRQFVVYQGRWSAAFRDFERDILPMCEAEGMGVTPWGALGSCDFKTEEQRKSQEGRNMGQPPSEEAINVSKVLEKLAEEKGTIMTSVALAYLMHKAPYAFPIVSGRKVDHLRGNIEALSLKLSPRDIEEIEEAYPFDVGFPLSFLFPGMKIPNLKGNDIWLNKMNGECDVVERAKPIEPRSRS